MKRKGELFITKVEGKNGYALLDKIKDFHKRYRTDSREENIMR
jgi:hypothetical protein